ncbi:MAG: 1-acyl-sn-glycerol-3-phosphate acyltransferase, partial [Candidatus Hydrogenedentes bacterium]|nr:1-acyl-sn-glycerol-3-phosphate acyltransferase [Candidatus Hydrogenedentota bacterium]
MASSTFAVSLTRWSLDLATKLIKADVRLHNKEVIQDGMAIMFVVNHFTRLETILLPYVFLKHTGREVWGLAAAELFQGKVGQFLRSTGTVSTKDPDRDKIIVRSLLTGEHPWMIFPEGAMIKDKKVIDQQGQFSIYNDGKRRPPHTGAAVLALRAEFCRHKLECLQARPGQAGLPQALEMFNLSAVEEVVSKRTVIVPVNVTYFPIRARDNLFLRMAKRFAEDLSERTLEELSVEGTVVSEDTDIDITLGDPIDVREYLNAPEYADLMACGLDDLKALEEDISSRFNDAARKLMLRYMEAIYRLTTINYDHIFATIIRHQQTRSFTERAFRNRVFLAAHHLRQLGSCRLHTLLERTYRDIVYEDPSAKFHDFMSLCLQEHLIQRDGDKYVKNFGLKRGSAGFHAVRFEELTEVIANEIEPLREETALIQQIAHLPRFLLSKRIRDIFLREDQQKFEADYTKFYEAGQSKGPEVGRPFLLKPLRIKAGI